jgi:hypothetical protein
MKSVLSEVLNLRFGLKPNALFQGGQEAMRHALASTTDWVRVKNRKSLPPNDFVRTGALIFEEMISLDKQQVSSIGLPESEKWRGCAKMGCKQLGLAANLKYYVFTSHTGHEVKFLHYNLGSQLAHCCFLLESSLSPCMFFMEFFCFCKGTYAYALALPVLLIIHYAKTMAFWSGAYKKKWYTHCLLNESMHIVK